MRPRRWWTRLLVLAALVAWILGGWRSLFPPVSITDLAEDLLDDMVICPSGKLRHASSSEEVPIRAFFADRFEVTRQEYAAFLDANPDQPRPLNWRELDPRNDPRAAELPMGWVTWYEARAYARWVGKRLPTTAEWMWCMRGPLGRKFPWGSAAQHAVANTVELGIEGPTPVGLFEDGRSPFGLYDLVGNVWEWTATPGGLEFQDRFYMLGGSYRERLFSGTGELTILEPGDRNLRGPRFCAGDTGFRCVLDAEHVRIARIVEDLGYRDPLGVLFYVMPAERALREIGEPCLPFLEHAADRLREGYVRQTVLDLMSTIRQEMR